MEMSMIVNERTARDQGVYLDFHPQFVEGNCLIFFIPPQ
jgi:hypothetical protein